MRLEIQAQDHISVDIISTGECRLSQRIRCDEEFESCIFIAPENIEKLCGLLLIAKSKADQTRHNKFEKLEGNL